MLIYTTGVRAQKILAYDTYSLQVLTICIHDSFDQCGTH